jgi:hypothetical protein
MDDKVDSFTPSAACGRHLPQEGGFLYSFPWSKRDSIKGMSFLAAQRILETLLHKDSSVAALPQNDTLALSSLLRSPL